MGIKAEARKMVPKTICKEVMVPAEEQDKIQPAKRFNTSSVTMNKGGSVKGRPAKRSAENS